MNTNIIKPLSTCPRTIGKVYVLMYDQQPTIATRVSRNVQQFNDYGSPTCVEHREVWAVATRSKAALMDDCDFTGWIDWAGELQPETVDPDVAFGRFLIDTAAVPLPSKLREWAKANGHGEIVDRFWPETAQADTIAETVESWLVANAAKFAKLLHSEFYGADMIACCETSDGKGPYPLRESDFIAVVRSFVPYLAGRIREGKTVARPPTKRELRTMAYGEAWAAKLDAKDEPETVPAETIATAQGDANFTMADPYIAMKNDLVSPIDPTIFPTFEDVTRKHPLFSVAVELEALRVDNAKLRARIVELEGQR